MKLVRVGPNKVVNLEAIASACTYEDEGEFRLSLIYQTSHAHAEEVFEGDEATLLYQRLCREAETPEQPQPQPPIDEALKTLQKIADLT